MVIDETTTNSLLIFRQLLHFFRANGVDILHTHGYKANILASLAARLTGAPRVVRTVHGLPEPFRGFQRIKMMTYALFNDVIDRYITDKIIAVSMDLKQSFQTRYDDGRVICVHNAIDLQRIKVDSDPINKKKELQIPPSSRVIGTVGRLTPIKAVSDFVRAARLIADERSDVVFLIVGDGPLRRVLEKLSRELRLETVVRFLGHRDDVYDLINLMDIFVLPSLHEGLPTALLEALAMGKRVVATRVGGIPEVITHLGTGVLVNPRDPSHLAEACLTLLSDSVDTNDLTSAKRNFENSQFTADANGRKVADLYTDLFLSNRSAISPRRPMICVSRRSQQ